MQSLKRVIYPKVTPVRFFSLSKPLSDRWYPDVDFVEKYSGPFFWATESMRKHCKVNYTGIIRPVERQVKNMIINFGPQHPAAHGVLRLVLELSGETVLKATPHVGFLHRATEKLMESKHYIQSVPFMDRLDYVSTIGNEQAFCIAVETLLNIEVPPRAKAIRVMCAELCRIANHLLNVSGTVLDAGGITPFFWMCEEREKIYEMFERLCGARVHCGYVRPGGVSQDLPIGYLEDLHEFLCKISERCDETEDVVTGNRLYYARTAGIGCFTAAQALTLGFSGPMLRSTGVKWDLRIAFPYDGYEMYDFDVPVGTYGDTYDRHLLRLAEMRQSLRILDQVINTIPAGEIRTDDSKITLPKREEMKMSMESLIHHFKLCTEGFPVPPGATYTSVECPKGELGLYMVADGTSKPYRVGIKPCSLNHLFAFSTFTANSPRCMLADIGIIIATMDVVFGDVDR